VNAAAGKGQGAGTDSRFTNSQVSGQRVELESGGDTNLQGAVVSANQVTANVGTNPFGSGGNLTIESLQSTATYNEKNKSAGGAITFGPAPGGSLSAGQSKVTSDFKSVGEQSAIRAGDSGFQVNVQGNTDLKGGVIASNDNAIANNKNSLVTGTLTTSDIRNQASASASTSGINLSTDMFTQGKYGLAKAVVTNALNSANADSNSSGQSKAAVSAGVVTINDEAAQQALTDNTASQTVASLSRDTAGAQVAAQRQDAQALQRQVVAERAIMQEAVKQFTTLTDESYRVMFKTKPEFYKVTCPAGANCTTNPELAKTELVRGSLKDVQDEIAKADKGTVLAVNGIFNPLERAGQLAMQNAEPVNKTEANPTGEKPATIYLMHYIPANNTISELMVAAYEKSLAPTLGYTNQNYSYAGALQARGADETTSQGHSRGTIVQTNANNILNQLGYTNPNLTVQGVGGAVTAQTFTDAAVKVQGPGGDPNKITFNYFKNDPVPVATGGNPGVLSLSEFWNVLKTPNSTHSCYGTGAAGCQQVEVLSPNAPSGAVQNNDALIRFKGGQQVDVNGNPVAR
jgi:filamentous hemagglutinin